MDTTVEILRAAAEPTRLRLLRLLAVGELTVSELVRVLGQSQPRLSRHLRILAEVGLLERLREGSWVFYRVPRSGSGAQRARTILEMESMVSAEATTDLERLEDITKVRQAAALTYFRKNAGEWDQMRALNVDDEAVAEAMAKLLPLQNAESLLDLGTGTGRLLLKFAPGIKRTHGIDLSAEMLQVARANIKAAGLENISLRQADLTSLPFDGETFDAITCHQVLHFLDNPQSAVAEAARVLVPGGVLLIADLAPHDIEDLRDHHAHRRLGFDDNEVKSWFSSAGLKTQATVHLKGSPLSVTLWLAAKGNNKTSPKPPES